MKLEMEFSITDRNQELDPLTGYQKDGEMIFDKLTKHQTINKLQGLVEAGRHLYEFEITAWGEVEEDGAPKILEIDNAEKWIILEEG